jgi:predicted nucleic acid-binding protein
MILVDTSVWIDFFNGYESVEAVHLRGCIEEMRPLTLPGVVLTEILLGMRSDEEAERVAHVLSAFDPMPELDATDYRKAAEIYRVCRTRGLTIRSTIDCLIAQLCLRHGYELLAKDRDFDSIAAFFPLQRVGNVLMVHDRPQAQSAR